MAPSFQIDADSSHCLLRITLTGFFTPADVADLDEAKRAAHRRLQCAANTHVTLVDVSDCKIQPQTVVGAFSRMVTDPRYRARRLAFVTGSSLARMQVSRIVAGLPHVRCFDDRRQAEAWLTEPTAAAAA